MSAYRSLGALLARATLTLILSLLIVSCAGTGETWQRIQSNGVLRVGLDPTYPPFETADDGDLRGIDVDLAHAIGRQLDLDIEFAYFGYDGLYDALATDQVDVLISALVIRPDQMRDFAFSDPYFNAGQHLVVPSQDTAVDSVEDLEGKTVSVELGAQGHVVASGWQREYRGLEVSPYQTPQEALNAVAEDRADAAVVDAVSALVYVAQNGDLRLLEQPVTVEPFALVVRIEDERLLQELNAAMEMLDESGQLQTIISRHMETMIEP